MKRLFTGLQPSGKLHIGNYFGALKPLADLAKLHKEYDGIYLMVADYHALTTLKKSDELRSNIDSIVRDYLAVLGDNHEHVVIFQQSNVSEHTELTWVLNSVVTDSFLRMAHAFKDKKAKGLEANFALIDYPVLMAADILLYSDPAITTWVPVGDDQGQHLEYTREIAGKFNAAFGTNVLSSNVSQHKFGDVGKIPGTDGQKMSKSYNNTIPLFGTKDEIHDAVMSIVTNSSAGKPDVLFAIHSAFRLPTEIEFEYTKGNNFKQLKEMLVEDIEGLIAPMRERRDSISDDDVRSILAEGGAKAKARAQDKMAQVREAIGISL